MTESGKIDVSAAVIPENVDVDEIKEGSLDKVEHAESVDHKV
jgi:hypothetical protein